MKKIFIIFICLLLITGCGVKNGNSVSKLETTIYKNYNHTEDEINDAFTSVKELFTKGDSFYHASLLTIEYGNTDNTELEEKLKHEHSADDAIVVTFTFETGDVAYISMESNYKYNYVAYLIKQTSSESWQVVNTDII